MDRKDVLTVFPRRKAEKRNHRLCVNVTKAQLEERFHLPLPEAATELGICTTSAKKLCRKLGIKKWPYCPWKARAGMIQKMSSEQDQKPLTTPKPWQPIQQSHFVGFSDSMHLTDEISRGLLGTYANPTSLGCTIGSVQSILGLMSVPSLGATAPASEQPAATWAQPAASSTWAPLNIPSIHNMDLPEWHANDARSLLNTLIAAQVEALVVSGAGANDIQAVLSGIQGFQAASSMPSGGSSLHLNPTQAAASVATKASWLVNSGANPDVGAAERHLRQYSIPPHAHTGHSGFQEMQVTNFLNSLTLEQLQALVRSTA